MVHTLSIIMTKISIGVRFAVKTFESMFRDANAFNKDISTKLVTVGGDYVFVAWDTSQATNMIRTFQSATSYNQALVKLERVECN